MAREEAPPFSRGETYYNGATIDTNNLPTQLEGKVWVFEDIDLNAGSGTGAKPYRSARKVECMVVKNASGITLLPKRLVTFKKTAGTPVVGQVDGYGTTTAVYVAGVVDEFLPATGVVNNDYFWIVRKGPSLVLSDLASGVNNSIAVGDVLVALTAATSQATTAGRVAPQDLTGATALLGLQVQNRLGRAMSAQTTTQTNSDLLVDVVTW